MMRYASCTECDYVATIQTDLGPLEERIVARCMHEVREIPGKRSLVWHVSAVELDTSPC